MAGSLIRQLKQTLPTNVPGFADRWQWRDQLPVTVASYAGVLLGYVFAGRGRRRAPAIGRDLSLLFFVSSSLSKTITGLAADDYDAWHGLGARIYSWLAWREVGR